MTDLQTYWTVCILTPVVLALWVYTVHRGFHHMDNLSDKTNLRFSWRRDFAPAAAFLVALVVLLSLIGE